MILHPLIVPKIRVWSYLPLFYRPIGNLLCKMEGREAEAFSAFDRAIELCPPYYEAHLNRGALHMRVGQHERALADFLRTLEIKPTEHRAMFEIGTLRLQRGEFRSALASYLDADRIAPDDADLQSNIGLTYSELGMGSDSLDRYRCAMRSTRGTHCRTTTWPLNSSTSAGATKPFAMRSLLPTSGGTQITRPIATTSAITRGRPR